MLKEMLRENVSTSDYGVTKPLFCAAPWTESVLNHDGALRVCAKLGAITDWLKLGLKEAFNGKAYQDFRFKVANGIIPNSICKNCVETKTTRSLSEALANSIESIKHDIKFRIESYELNEILRIYRILKNEAGNGQLKDSINAYRRTLGSLSYKYPVIAPYFSKLEKLLDVSVSFYNKDLIAKVIAPYRLVGLKSKCNARCLHCPGRYNGWIDREDDLDEKYIDEAFSFSDDITCFFMMGAEFLFIKNWKKISLILKDAYIKPAIGTNGILLTPDTIRFLIDNKICNLLNISLDGGTKETIERVRVNVNYDKLIKNIQYLFSYAYEKKCNFNLNFSFVIMKSTYKEFPELIKLMCETKKKINGSSFFPELSFGASNFDPFDIPGYNEFVKTEHITLVNEAELKKMFNRAREYSEKYNVYVGVYKDYSIKNYIDAGYPAPTIAGFHVP